MEREYQGTSRWVENHDLPAPDCHRNGLSTKNLPEAARFDLRPDQPTVEVHLSPIVAHPGMCMTNPVVLEDVHRDEREPKPPKYLFGGIKTIWRNKKIAVDVRALRHFEQIGDCRPLEHDALNACFAETSAHIGSDLVCEEAASDGS
jgi:hypothetical protein